MKKAFTLIELVVAVAILAMVLSFAGVIFKVSIDAYRTAMANTEIMQKLRAITDQLNADFKGLRKDTQGKVRFVMEQSRIGGAIVNVNSDCIMFLADGDFQSVRQYRYIKSDGTEALKTVSGNVAIIFYGLIDPNSYDDSPEEPKEKILARRQTILTADSDLDFWGLDPPGEYYISSLSEWIANPPIDPNGLMVRPYLTLNNLQEEDLVVYMAKGVDDFTIEYEDGYTAENKLNWSQVEEQIFTRALKFTFTLYDSRGVIERGRTFTHIVYIGD